MNNMRKLMETVAALEGSPIISDWHPKSEEEILSKAVKVYNLRSATIDDYEVEVNIKNGLIYIKDAETGSELAFDLSTWKKISKFLNTNVVKGATRKGAAQ